MSLQLWLPLNGNFTNYGLAPGITIVNNENRVIFANEGRINTKSAYFDTSYGKKTYLKTNYAPNIGTGNFSIAFWIKISSDLVNYDTNFPHIVSTKNANAANLGFAVIYQKSDNTIGLRVCNGSNSNNPWAKIANIDFSNYFNLWIHIILIRDNNRTKNGCAFINGILYDYDSSVSALDAGNKIVYIGDVASDNGYYPPLPMHLSDLRIYDHALSDKEAKELAKGLILHYKLDNNDIEETYNYFTAAGSHLSPYIVNWYSSSSTDSYYSYSLRNLSGNDIYYYSAYVDNTDGEVGIRAGLDIDGSTGKRFYTNFIPPGKTGWIRRKIDLTDTETYTGSSAYLRFWARNADNSGAILRKNIPSTSITKIQYSLLEKHDHLTAWTLGGTTRTASTEIKDVSGYGNDGVVVGTPTVGFNSRRYEYYIHLDAGLHIRALNRVNTFLPTQALTVSAWVRYSTNGSVVSCTQSAGMNLYPTSFSVYIGSSLKKKTVTASSTNEWHMLTGVFDGTEVNYYQDGIKIGNGLAANGVVNYTNNSLFIGAEASSGTSAETSNHIVGDISDVRIYATALTQEDIQELYQASASIDNKLNIYSREFIEDNNKVSILQNGQLLMDAVEEDSSTASFYDTKVVKGQLIYEY